MLTQSNNKRAKLKSVEVPIEIMNHIKFTIGDAGTKGAAAVRLGISRNVLLDILKGGTCSGTTLETIKMVM